LFVAHLAQAVGVTISVWQYTAHTLRGSTQSSCEGSNMEAIISGLVASLAMLFLLVKLDLRKCLGYDAVIDISVTVFLTYLFTGTYAGMSAAMIAGLILSVQLIILKRLIGAERLDLKKSWHAKAPVWVEIHRGYLQK
jgi:hypothetical protein